MFINRYLPFLALMLSACSNPANYVPAYQVTPSPVVTPDAYEVALGNIQAQATLDAMKATSQAISAELTATAYAPTQQAIETATERAWAMSGWTVTAAVEQTASAAQSTATAQAWTPTPNHTATVESARAAALATAAYGEAVSVELAVERERMMNEIWAITPWAALTAVLITLLVIVVRWSQVRPIQRDARGDAPLLVVDGRVYDADRNPLSVADFSGRQAQIPVLAPPELQSATTARDQMIDLATRGNRSQPQRRALAQRALAPQLPPANSQPALPPIEVVDAVEVREWIDEARQKLLTDGGDS